MKLALIFLITPFLAFSCEQHPLKSLREMYGLELLKRFQQEGRTKLFMFNHAIAHNDLEALKILYTQAINTKSQKVIYEDFQLSQARREGGEPIYFYPLHLAAQFGASEVAIFCLENGANVNNTTQSNLIQLTGNTPAHLALMYKKYDTLQLLLKQPGVKLDIKNAEGKTLEDIAREKNDETALAIIKMQKNR
jgi:Ankyrin repeats (many copies)